MISGSTSRVRCSVGPSGGWRWQRSRLMTWLLRSDTEELDLLAKDLLINVTSFFRDPKVFDLLARNDRSRRGPQSRARSTSPDLDCRVQHG
jgi:hypothetical protein